MEYWKQNICSLQDDWLTSHIVPDYIELSNIFTDQMLYTGSELEAAMYKIETINFH